ncbi:MAG: DNA-directed RNA polymerase subunit beta, DNA-directed RNA polymerase subunit beta' [candidate division Kazan bacterium GW2011_GWA1_50_15]|uniref:DNA-directed RNA polymerase subunit beta' n=2 Tax=Bacteria division Kazan-3B-28 TaxID=1798534 RepID=A0A0G1X6C6_UNCK3|nr:MAG: DNA-directed RNA polymerase subunit beta, DNA-directed RNA polymerase subunit beta' [candidate division Kazan bacterium GW2011_GWA1_50_15]KKW25391.1 MAG: DNA-directed RNA polymerase subunit beta' [candidate division Kazan bacterium GW2011_GWC1_52_13]KKW26698.1 MAG: DNA-directed RNA polymerase subunit beta' [candidate division Kazan bacterium GW2011_GWB1_52_7]HAV66145.1 DNA-directed RNA polymerase subunit beta' [Patescibacteria group bacterium]HCR42846.1 DNA-directed RNA polymerase subun
MRTTESTHSHADQADFLAVRIGVASPEQMLAWSHGEITKPETINYRTLRPEKDGLFDERIFGPTKDWECYCGKYKKIRYKGIVCDKCGVEVTRAVVRRERMGHIQLATPVSHIWYLKGTPSRLGLALNVPAKRLEQVIYFAAYIITHIDEDARKNAQEQLEQEYKSHVKNIKNDIKQTGSGEAELEERLAKLKVAYQTAVAEVKELHLKKIVSEHEYRNLSLKYGQVFRASIGAEAVYQMIKDMDLEDEVKQIKAQLKAAAGQKYKRLQKRFKLLEGFIKAGLHPSWMLITTLPVIPPDLRPMVQLDGGRFATSDLNDLYRRVINRNNRLKKLIEIDAPEVITRNEKRMLQEAVDSLFDITARETSTTATAKRKLKSLSDLLKGKQGRFRQNLLGKRVDYSGRSVIVVGPNLRLDECGVPKSIALELFKPFVISVLLRDGLVHNVKTAGKMVEKEIDEVWDALEEVVSKHHVLLNRAPTLHRLGIQAFQPILVEGNAIQLHPLTCTAFNADFDGDQMAIHLPLSAQAQLEAREIMLSTKNLLKPATGDPIVLPDQDIVLGVYYLTIAPTAGNAKSYICRDIDEAKLAYEAGAIGLHTALKVPLLGKMVDTTLGRLIFNEPIPEVLGYVNEVIDKKALKRVINDCYKLLGDEASVRLVNSIKDLGFRYATLSGATFSVGDLDVPTEKGSLISNTDAKVENIKSQFKEGLITADERRRLVTNLWGKTKHEIEMLLKVQTASRPLSPITMMVSSGARGSLEQLNQTVGIVGVKVNPAGQIIELPVKSNYKEGLNSLEYFLSTHGARKGLSDTALRTSDAGYLTRRLVDVCQDIVVAKEDCHTTRGVTIYANTDDMLGDPFAKRIDGRFLAEDVKDAKGKLVASANDYITEDLGRAIAETNVPTVKVRSMITCESEWGVCQHCYGKDLATGRLVEMGEAVGIVAAQSIGEPGTQLTMKTFHTGGVASAADITQGLPRVEELFEARIPKAEAIMAPADGLANIMEVGNKKFLRLQTEEEARWEITLSADDKPLVKAGDKIKKGDPLYTSDQEEVKAPASGTVTLDHLTLGIAYRKKEAYEYPLGHRTFLRIQDGDKVTRGQQITEGQLNLRDLMKLKGLEATQRYVIDEIQKIYSLQGQNINDKHVEAVVRQMFSKVRIEREGDSEFMLGEIIDRLKFERFAATLVAKGKQPPLADHLLLGVSKAALNTESFLSAASFQETTRVLVNAAVLGKVDYLKGLKENVIVGRLIPAGTGFRHHPAHLIDKAD